MGEVKNGKGPKKVHLRLKIDDKLYVIGTLSAEDRPQILFDLVLHKEFELSHDWKDGSIYLAGYIGDDESCEYSQLYKSHFCSLQCAIYIKAMIWKKNSLRF